MTLQVFQHRIVLALLLGAPVLLTGCIERYHWEKENLQQVEAKQEQSLSEAKAASGKADALNERLDRQLSQRR